LLPAGSRQQLGWTLPDTVNTVKCSWWWAKTSPETCREPTWNNKLCVRQFIIIPSFPDWIINCLTQLHLVGHFYKIWKSMAYALKDFLCTKDIYFYMCWSASLVWRDPSLCLPCMVLHFGCIMTRGVICVRCERFQNLFDLCFYKGLCFYFSWIWIFLWSDRFCNGADKHIPCHLCVGYSKLRPYAQSSGMIDILNVLPYSSKFSALAGYFNTIFTCKLTKDIALL